MPAANDIGIELAFGTAGKQQLLKLTVPAGTTVEAAIELSGLAGIFPGQNLARLQAGIWGKPVDREHCLQNGDRLELYRPLDIDPRDARRMRAAAGKTMAANSGRR